jgi:hypothetical protein
VTASEPSPEWQDTVTRTASVLSAASSTASPHAAGSPLAAFLAAAAGGGSFSAPPDGLLGATMRSGAGIDPAMLAGGPGVVGTTGGLKALGQVAAEAQLNAELLAALGSGGAAASSSFTAARDFAAFSRGLEVLPRLAADSGAAGPGPGSAAAAAAASGSLPRAATRLGSPRGAVRLSPGSAPLPPAAISLPASALRSLRDSVRATTSAKPGFAASFKPLSSHEADKHK